MTSTAKVVVVTGCSDGGIGASLASTFHYEGCRVFATARKLESMALLKEQGIEVIQLDVCSEDSIKEAVAQVVELAGRIDILVNNAGVPCVGPIVDVRLDRVRRAFETNVFGLLRLTQEVVPHMAKQRSGTVVNIGSVVGLIPLPFGGIYAATKAAVHNLTHLLRVELKPFGIKVVLVSPGAIKSNFGNNGLAGLDPNPDSIYGDLTAVLEKRAQASQSGKSMATDAFGKSVVRNVLRRRPKPWHILGHMSRMVRFMTWLPLWLVDRMAAKPFGLHKPLPSP